MKTATIWLLPVLIALRCAAFNEQFVIGVSTDRGVYRPGEPVEITGTVTNATAKPQLLKFRENSCRSYDVWIENSRGEIVARDNRICLFVWQDGLGVEPFTSFPLEANRWWQNTGEYGANHPPPHPEHVGPGTYRVVVEYHLKERVESAPFVICHDLCPEPRSVLIPGAGNNPGLQGTLWSTDLALQGLGGGATVINISMLAHGPAGAPAQPVEIVVPDLGTLQIANVLGGLFDHEGPAVLLLEVRGGDLHVSGRTVNTTDSGTFAQALPALPVDTGRHAVLIPGLRHSGDVWRTNLGMVNLLPFALEVDVVLNTGTGTAVPIGPITLGPHEFRQLNDVFRNHVDPRRELVTASIWIAGSDASSPASFVAYGSVIDNRTGDAVFVRGEPAGGENNPY